VISKCIERAPLSTAGYINSRFIQTKQLKKLSRLPGKELRQDDEEDQSGVVDVSDLWPLAKTIKEKFFVEGDSDAHTKLYILDIPLIHHPAYTISDDVF